MFHSRKDSSSRSRVLETWFRRRSGDKESLNSKSDPGSTMTVGFGNRSPGPATSSTPAILPLVSPGLEGDESHLQPAASYLTIPTQTPRSKKPTSASNVFGQYCAVCGNLGSPCSIPWLDLKQSGGSGCQACKVLVDGVDSYFNVAFIGLRRGGSGSLDRSVAEKLLRIHLRPSRGALRVGVGWADMSGLFDQCEFYTEINHQVSPWSGLGAARSVARETKGSFDTLQGWIQHCMMAHPGCNTNVGSLPLRVIDVGKPGKQRPFLYISRGEPDFYTALSHCWGSSALLQTTTSNINAHKREIPFTALSETFKNAIVTTQDLGIQYLWIDSICILQDDMDDWEVQSGNMATIYSNAQVVLAATDAEDGTHGFLSRNPSQPEKGPFTMENGTSKPYSVFVRNVRRHFSFRLQYGGIAQLEHPLFRRAWAFQEELLASRIVHFTKSELIWECKTALACECMDLDSYDPKSAKLLYHASLLPTAAKEDKFINWQRIVTSYMGKDISFEKDRIPALAGLAAQMQAAGAGQYLAGLWREHLLLDLLWVAWQRQRANPYKAPTWSWTSTEGDSNSSLLFYHAMKPDSMHYIDRIRAKVIDIDWKVSGQELNSSVIKGSLKLKAPIIEVQVLLQGKESQRPEIHYKGLRGPCMFDLKHNNLTGPIFCLLVAEAVVIDHPTVHAIILQQSASDTQIYKRIGTMIPEPSDFSHGFESRILHPDRWFKDVKDSVVTVI